MKTISAVLLLLSLTATSLSQSSDDGTSGYRVLLTVDQPAPKNSPIVATIDFQELLQSNTLVVARNSIQVIARDKTLPCSVSGDIETSGTATIAWRSIDPAQREYYLNFGTSADTEAIRTAGPIGIGATFRFNNGEPGPANVTPLHSQFLHVDWDRDGLRDLIGWGFRVSEHGQELENRLGNAVYFLKNVCTNAEPLFAARRQLLDSKGN